MLQRATGVRSSPDLCEEPQKRHSLCVAVEEFDSPRNASDATLRDARDDHPKDVALLRLVRLDHLQNRPEEI